MGAAAAIIIRKEKEIVRAFRGAGATSTPKAASTSELGVDERVAFHLLRRRNVLREASAGRYYLDEAAWEQMGRRRRSFLVVILAVAVVAAVVAAIITTHAR
jgi:hypothetical protein